jgi:outer membrane protein OmpA-like peptidoglycan-associated protein
MANGQFLPPNPRISGQGAPALATVPTKAPTPKSTKQDRDKITEGLLSDMNRARYTDSGGRTMPVAVRPLTEAQAQINDAPAIPPKPPAAPAGAVTRLGEPPPPGAQAQAGGTHEPTEPSDSAKASVEAAAKLAANEPAPKLPAMEGPMPSNLPVARTDGFHPLGAYASTTSQSNQVASIEFVGPGTTLTAVQRRALADAAQLGQRTKGSFRVIGRTTQASNLVEERATSVAQELQRLGVAQDRIYVGTDVGTDGHVDVILDQ